MNHLSRRVLFTLTAGALAAVPFCASAADVAAVQAPIVPLDTALLAAMRSGKTVPFRQRYDALAPAIEGAFDIATILRTSVGSAYAALPPDQQAALLAVFQKFTIASYTANFDSFDGQRIDMLPALRDAGTEQIVQTRLVPASGDATPLDYVMRQGEAGWRAVDVLLNGSISRVAVQRSDFRSVLRPGSAQGLIDSLQRKVSDLSGGTLT